jgi:hypothetical protein
MSAVLTSSGPHRFIVVFDIKSTFFIACCDLSQVASAGGRQWLEFSRASKPGELPVTLPTKFEWSSTPRPPRTLGIAVPRSVQSRADEVIE